MAVPDDEFCKRQENREGSDNTFRRMQFNKGMFCREIPPIQVAPIFIRDYRDPNGALFFRKPPMPFTYIYI